MNHNHEIGDLDWINSNLADHAALSPQDIESTRNFALIWSIFEGTCCDQNASIRVFSEVAERVSRRQKVSEKVFTEALAYFSDRYIDNSKPNHTFDTLRFRPKDHKDLVERVLMGKLTETKDILLALLVIIFRLRNNLFHGIKAMHSIKSQRENFTQANKVLRRVIELYS